jgi:cation transport regulator ChaC
MALVFQYGSNCSAQRLNSQDRLRGDARPVGWAETVDNYELRFDVWSNGNECAASDIALGGDARVQGVLYEVPDRLMNRATTPIGRKSFDAIEGNAYERRPIRVRKRDGNIVEAETYVVRTPARDLLTSIDYVRHIVSGLREHGADDAYILRVKEAAITNNPAIAEEVRGL